MFLLIEIMLRKDLRTPLESKPFSVELGVVLEADGSAQIAMGNTRIVASVIGPTHPKYGRHEVFDHATIDVEVELPSNIVNSGLDTMQQKRGCESFLKESLATCIDLKRFPRLLILLKVLVVSNDGSILSAALNACILSILDAGLPMTCVPNAVSLCSIINADNTSTLVLDPSAEEEQKSLATYTFTVKPQSDGVDSGELLVSECSGSIDLPTLNESINVALQTSQQLLNTMRNAMVAKVAPNAV